MTGLENTAERAYMITMENRSRPHAPRATKKRGKSSFL